ncbi:MAG TPA: RNA polymerase sigma factor [Pirellulales bacterium]|jgi:RNA polymerase sigma-70 factor (ECF subfamily)
MADSPSDFPIARLVVDHHADVYRYAYRLCGSTADAEDLTQQTFLAAQVKLTQLRAVESARAWLFAILRNCYLKSRRRAPLPAANVELNVNEIPAQPPPESVVDRERLQAALNALPDDYKLVLLLFYFEEYSYREIADRLDIPLGTVMSRLSRAKGQLRGRLFELELQATGSRAAAVIHSSP